MHTVSRRKEVALCSTRKRRKKRVVLFARSVRGTPFGTSVAEPEKCVCSAVPRIPTVSAVCYITDNISIVILQIILSIVILQIRAHKQKLRAR